MPTRIGALRERVTIETFSSTEDTLGGRSSTGWTALATVWARVMPQAPFVGREGFEANALTAIQTYLITMRYRTDITLTPRHRLTWDGKTLQIHVVGNVWARDRFTVVQAAETL